MVINLYRNLQADCRVNRLQFVTLAVLLRRVTVLPVKVEKESEQYQVARIYLMDKVRDLESQLKEKDVGDSKLTEIKDAVILKDTLQWNGLSGNAG